MNQLLGVAECRDQVGDGRHRRLAKRGQASHAAGADFRALVKIHPAQEVAPVDARHFFDRAKQGLFPDRVGVAHRQLQPREGVGAEFRHSGMRGGAAVGGGGDE